MNNELKTPTRGSGDGAVPTAGVVVSMRPGGSASGSWEPWLREEAVARHYGVSARTFRRWRRGGMPSRVFGRVRRYRLSECESWHEQRRSP